MYFSRRVYVKRWDHQGEDKKYSVTVKRGGMVVPNKVLNPDKISYVTEEVAYWRKANHIHNWFVNNVQGGNDDCREYEVSDEQVKELVELCNRVLKAVKTNKPLPKNTDDWQEWEGIEVTNASQLSKILPPVDGFFFGGTDIDEYYLYDTLHTVESLQPLIDLAEDPEWKYTGQYYYEASW